MLLKDIFYYILFHLTFYFKRKRVVKRLFPWHDQSCRYTWMKSYRFSVSVKTDKIICFRLYSLWYFYPNIKEGHEKMGYLFQRSQTGTVEFFQSNFWIKLLEFVLNRNFQVMNNLCWCLQISLVVSTILSKYFKRRMNQISVLFQFLPKHIHIQYLLSSFMITFSILLFHAAHNWHHAPYSKVTFNDFHFQNY